MRISPIASALLGAAAFAAAACKKSATAVVCTQEARPAVTIVVVDSLSGVGVPLAGVWARVREGSYVDSSAAPVLSQGSPGFSLAYERPGTYTATVHVPGYRDWSNSGVVVSKTADGCHVASVALTARMVGVN